MTKFEFWIDARFAAPAETEQLPVVGDEVRLEDTNGFGKLYKVGGRTLYFDAPDNYGLRSASNKTRIYIKEIK